MIKIRGKVRLNLGYEIEVDMSSENLDKLSDQEFRDLICEKIDWDHAFDQMEFEDIKDVTATEIREYKTA
ncbi:hypothetical protein BEP19_15005 [Ammoniphilus oxalaticus]|uniref:Uncharacterized protein n=1 Tax=Ammoniphilus oxalaticus TaxID=66863 RepID=A0A419SDC2_9BACL|nr:hypothetical protein [Ammoniphilus oxalaticus]RKD20990.1 hypothetical protein BEP19_15005 [Ammoniphilus oxalaticus]